MATARPLYEAVATKRTGMLDQIRIFLTEISQNQREFYPSEIHRLAYDRRAELADVAFRHGAVRPYSEDLDDALSMLLVRGDLQLNSADSCIIVVSDALRRQAAGR